MCIRLRKIAFLVTACAVTIWSPKAALSGESNVFVNNETDSTVIVRFNHIQDMSGQQQSNSAYWTVAPNQSTRLILKDKDLQVSAVGFFLETTFGARTPTKHGKVWFEKAEGTVPKSKSQSRMT